MANGLTTKQEAFVLAYIGEARFNAAKAALIAGYSKTRARQTGHELVTNSDIRARIDEHLDTMALSAKEVLAELTDVASAEWRDFVTIRTDPKTGETLEVRMDLRSKVQALDLLGKHHKLFTDKVQHDGSEDFLAALRAFGGASGHSNT